MHEHVNLSKNGILHEREVCFYKSHNSRNTYDLYITTAVNCATEMLLTSLNVDCGLGERSEVLLKSNLEDALAQ